MPDIEDEAETNSAATLAQCNSSGPSQWVPSEYDKRATAVAHAVAYLSDNTGQLIDTANEILDFLNDTKAPDA